MDKIQLKFHLVIVGDEILSGKRQDMHFKQTLALLKQHDLCLASVCYLPDDEQIIAKNLIVLKQLQQPVFVCGGIGATPDDRTRQAAAKAFDSGLVLHEHAKQLIIQQIKKLAKTRNISTDLQHPENQQRMRLGEFPVGSQIIPNAVNNFPGFFIQQFYFCPGFPDMALTMMNWVLNNFYAKCEKNIEKEYALRVFNVLESTLIPLLEQIEADYEGVKTFSLPSTSIEHYIELGVKGEIKKSLIAFNELINLLKQKGISLR